MLKLRIVALSISNDLKQDMTIYSQQDANKSTNSSIHLFPSNFDLVNEVIDGEDEDGSWWIKSMDHVDGKVEEALSEDEAI